MSKVLVNVTGAQGGSGGGYGGWVQASLSVTAGQILYLFLGGVGNMGNGFNGGGYGGNWPDWAAGGGGASDIRTSSNDLTTRLVVAGGGGGIDYVSSIFSTSMEVRCRNSFFFILPFIYLTLTIIMEILASMHEPNMSQSYSGGTQGESESGSRATGGSQSSGGAAGGSFGLGGNCLVSNICGGK